MDTMNTDAIALLNEYIARLERLESEKQSIADHIKEVLADAKNSGFDTKKIKKIIELKKIPEDKRIAEEEELDLYKSAVGLR